VTLVEQETIFERIVSGYDVERWVVDVLKRWSATYVAEVERQHGIAAGSLPTIKGWVLAPSFDKWPEDQIPGVLVVSPGLVPPPEKTGYGVYRARWRIDVGVICSARTQQQSHEQAMLYLAAHKAIVVQKPSLEGHANGVAWIDESYDALDFDDTRSLYAATASLIVEVDNVLATLAGPAKTDPPTDPTEAWADWPRVATHDVDVANFADDAPLPEGSKT
jgi:hypothetical protein